MTRAHEIALERKAIGALYNKEFSFRDVANTIVF